MTISSQRLYLPFEQLFTNLGATAAGWKIYTYLTGTDTPRATYSNTELTIANTNPIIADSSGRVGNIYGDSAALYKFVLKDNIDNTVQTIDPVNPQTFNLSDFSPQPAAYWGVTSGTASAYTLASTVDISATGYNNTQIFLITFHIACNASPTLAIDGNAALGLVKFNGSGSTTALIAGDVQPQRYWATNNGSNIVILSPLQASETVAGISEVATHAETNTGTDDSRFITSLKLASKPGLTVQTVNVETGAVSTGSTVMPFDDSIPQNTEGDEYMSRAITPTNANNKLRIDVSIFASANSSSRITGALFQDSTAGALAANSIDSSSANGCAAPIAFTHYMTAGTTSATTFKVRAGMSTAGTTTFNGIGAARRLGGVLASSITITEITV